MQSVSSIYTAIFVFLNPPMNCFLPLLILLLFFLAFFNHLTTERLTPFMTMGIFFFAIQHKLYRHTGQLLYSFLGFQSDVTADHQALGFDRVKGNDCQSLHTSLLYWLLTGALPGRVGGRRSIFTWAVELGYSSL